MPHCQHGLVKFVAYPELPNFLSWLGPPSAPVDVVSSRISYDVDGNQCSKGSCRLHYYSSSADAESVVEPMNVGGGETETRSKTAVAKRLFDYKCFPVFTSTFTFK